MTSQLNVDTIVDKAGSGGTNVKMGNTSTYVSEGGAVTQNTVQGLAKVYNIFEPDTPTNLSSFNISTLTDNGTGDFTHTFTSSFSTNLQYTFAGSMANQPTSTGAYEYCKPRDQSSILTSSIRTATGYITPSAAAFYDYQNSNFSCHGDLA